MQPALHARQTPGAQVVELTPGRWRMQIPAGTGGSYRWAQLDDYLHLRRKDFPWRAPLRLELRARVSAPDLPGTWGFGLWNDPFSASLGVGGTARRLPALPNAAWFFYAGRPNYLAFQDTHPAQGFLAAAFAAPPLPVLLMAPGALAAPLALFAPTARLLRRAARLLIHEDAALVTSDPTVWHTYRLEWEERQAAFAVDGEMILRTHVAPRGPLGLVLWIDNQYAAFPPDGRIRTGTSPNPEAAWLEVEAVAVL